VRLQISPPFTQITSAPTWRIKTRKKRQQNPLADKQRCKQLLGHSSGHTWQTENSGTTPVIFPECPRRQNGLDGSASPVFRGAHYGNGTDLDIGAALVVVAWKGFGLPPRLCWASTSHPAWFAILSWATEWPLFEATIEGRGHCLF